MNDGLTRYRLPRQPGVTIGSYASERPATIPCATCGAETAKRSAMTARCLECQKARRARQVARNKARARRKA